MNELKLKLPGGGFLTIRKVVGEEEEEEQDSAMVEISGADPAGATMTATVLEEMARQAISLAKFSAFVEGQKLQSADAEEAKGDES